MAGPILSLPSISSGLDLYSWTFKFKNRRETFLHLTADYEQEIETSLLKLANISVEGYLFVKAYIPH